MSNEKETKTCENCKHGDGIVVFDKLCLTCSRNYPDLYEKAEESENEQ